MASRPQRWCAHLAIASFGVCVGCGGSVDEAPAIDDAGGGSGNDGGHDASGAPDATLDSGSNDATVDNAPAPDAIADVGTIDAADAAMISDAADAEAGEAGVTTYTDPRNPSAWQSFDLYPLNNFASAFYGGAFDGRRVYFAPVSVRSQTIAVAYDTSAPFLSPSSWSFFDMLPIDGVAMDHNGAVFDGRYVYYVPSELGNALGRIVRFDTRGTFTDPSAWTSFDTVGIAPTGAAYGSGVFDGRYVYFVPFASGRAEAGAFMGDGFVLRYDTTAPFASASSWTTHDASSGNPGATGFAGGIFDGRNVNFVPTDYPPVSSGVSARYDTQSSFGNAMSWSSFGVSSNYGHRTFFGGAFDGRFVYFVPEGAGLPPMVASGGVVRSDTLTAFTDAGSWTLFDTTTVNANAKGYFGAAFDGRRIYFAPHLSPTLAVYDTSAPFGVPASWTTIDTSTLVTGSPRFGGAIFDGRYVYLVPFDYKVLRFDAKYPASMPPGYSGSFF